MNIYVSGSLAFDRIMRVPDRFCDLMIADKLEILNVSFLIESLTYMRGGTAANIAYVLALLGEKPYILGSVGSDFGEYSAYLAGLGLPLDGIKIIEGQTTAGCYLLTDTTNNQINGFHPAAMAFSCDADLSAAGKGDWGIVSPGNPDDMHNLPATFREKGVSYIFDPGQQIPRLTGDALLSALTGSDLLVTNDYELEMICQATNRTRAELRGLTGCLLTTRGAEGIVINNGEGTTTAQNETISHIPAVPVGNVVDPTGAGDALRSGLLKGLALGWDIPRATRLGATCAAYSVETKGTQEFTFTFKELAARHKAAFNEDLQF